MKTTDTQKVEILTANQKTTRISGLKQSQGEQTWLSCTGRVGLRPTQERRPCKEPSLSAQLVAASFFRKLLSIYYMYVYMHIYIHMYIWVCVCKYTYTYIYIHMCIYQFWAGKLCNKRPGARGSACFRWGSKLPKLKAAVQGLSR